MFASRRQTDDLIWALVATDLTDDDIVSSADFLLAYRSFSGWLVHRSAP